MSDKAIVITTLFFVALGIVWLITPNPAEAYTQSKPHVYWLDAVDDSTSNQSPYLNLKSYTPGGGDCRDSGNYTIHWRDPTGVYTNGTYKGDYGDWVLVNRTVSNGCEIGWIEFGIGGLPSGIVVDEVWFVYNSTGDTIACDIKSHNSKVRPSGILSAYQWWTVFEPGYPLPITYANGVTCGGTGEFEVQLTGGAASNLQASMTSPWAFFDLAIGPDNALTGSGASFNITNARVKVIADQPPDPPYGSAEMDPWVGMNVTWFSGGDYLDTHDVYQLFSWDGVSVWDKIFEASTEDYFDTSPTAAPTNRYEIYDVGVSGEYSCGTPILPGNLSQHVVSYYSLCGTMGDSGPHAYDLTYNQTAISNFIALDEEDDGWEYYDSDWWMDFGNKDSVVGDGNDINYTSWWSNTDSQWINGTGYWDMGHTPFTMNAWVRYTGNWTDDSRVNNIWTFGSSQVGGNTITKIRCNSAGEANFLIRNVTLAQQVTASGIDICYGEGPDSGSPASAHMITAMYDGCNNANCMHLYIDGVWAITGGTGVNWSPNSMNPEGPILLGGHSFPEGGDVNNANAFSGLGRDWVLFNRTLTDDEIWWMYQETVDSRFPTTPLSNLNATIVDLDSTRLEFTVPSPTGILTPVCFQVNYTTPLGDPQTEAIDCIYSSGEIIVDGLNNFANDYSFRVGANNLAVINSTGAPIANTSSANMFAVGNIQTPTGTNPSALPIRFVEDSINENQTVLQVIYDETYDLECRFEYTYGMNNVTYGNLTETIVLNNEVESNFTINDPEREIIDVYCYDINDSTITGQYRLDQLSIPLFNQMVDFQDGLFDGTLGYFGFFDFVTLIVVVVSTIGFNRYNPALGVVVMIAMLGALTYYEVIAWQSSLIGVSALVLMLAIIQVRKP